MSWHQISSYLEGAAERHSSILLTIRLFTLVTLVLLLTMHVRSIRVFRWEHSFSGGILVTFGLATLGLAICAGKDHSGARILQIYLTFLGFALFALNAGVLLHRWEHAGELTRVVADLLRALGVRLGRQVKIKIALSVIASIAFLADLVFAPWLTKKDAYRI